MGVNMWMYVVFRYENQRMQLAEIVLGREEGI
jgi:hypothetical protein